MDPLIIDATKSTPAVRFDPADGMLQIEGQSYPENAFKFYEPVMAWIDRYLTELSQATTVTFQLELPYINTSSTKCFVMLLEQLEQAHQEGKQVAIQWVCNPENENELECAEEFREDLTLPFRIVTKAEADY